MPRGQSSFKYNFFILGCQFNYYDAARVSHELDILGGSQAKLERADIIIALACSVRQKAVDRLIGHIKNWRAINSKVKIVVGACVLPADRRRLAKKVERIASSRELKTETAAILKSIGIKYLTNDSKTCAPVSVSPYQLYNPRCAYLAITSGCNNFCTFCAVPYTRTREISYPASHIIREAKDLARGGITHIILLGQNVNSYGLSDFMPRDLRKNRSPAGKLWTPANPSPFVKLLKRLEKVPKLEKITFLSPNPQDISGDIIDWMKRSPKFGRELNLPLQSGSDQVLERMNRRYSQKQYLALVEHIHRAVPDIFLSTDIIVGFPGETKSDFLESKKVAKICGFQKSFIAMYSPRAGTAAAKMPDDVPRAEKKRRWEVLEKMINQRSNHENTRE